MMSLLSVAGIRKMLNNIMKDLRPCKIKSRIEINGIEDQIARKTAKIKFYTSVSHSSWTDVYDFNIPLAERKGKVAGAYFGLRVGLICAADRREAKRAKLSSAVSRRQTDAPVNMDRRASQQGPTHGPTRVL